MSSTLIRPFVRGDREQVTSLVNAHIAAVVPGVSVSVQALLSQLEREPGEFIVDRWVRDRVTLVAEQRGRVVAAAHLLRYGDGEDTGENYRDAGEIRWLVCWPDAPYWPDASAAGDALAVACHAQFRRWGVSRRLADGQLPAPAVYGLPEQWPHIRAIYERIGFRHDGPTEIVYLARVDRLARPEAPVGGLTTRRTVGINGTRITAVLDGADAATSRWTPTSTPARGSRARGPGPTSATCGWSRPTAAGASAAGSSAGRRSGWTWAARPGCSTTRTRGRKPMRRSCPRPGLPC